MRTLGNVILDELRAALSITLPPLPATLRTQPVRVTVQNAPVPVRIHPPRRIASPDRRPNG